MDVALAGRTGVRLARGARGAATTAGGVIPAGIGDELAVGRPDRVPLVVGRPGKVVCRAHAVDRHDPDVAVEVGVLVRSDEPFAVRRPVVLDVAERIYDLLGAAAVGGHDPKFAAVLNECDARTVRAPG